MAPRIKSGIAASAARQRLLQAIRLQAFPRQRHLNTTNWVSSVAAIAIHFDDRVMGGVMAPPTRRMRLHHRGHGCTNDLRLDQLAKQLGWPMGQRHPDLCQAIVGAADPG
jgi:hypothetical protein